MVYLRFGCGGPQHIHFGFLVFILFVLLLRSSFSSATETTSSTNGTETSDKRCKCVCPRVNGTGRALFIKNVSPEQCNCDYVILHQLAVEGIKEDPSEFCARCQCKHESRNSATIKTVVICFIVVTGLLLIYMVYLLIEARLCKGKSFGEDSTVSYEQHLDEDYLGQQSGEEHSKSLRNRFSEQMSKWKRAVMQQRGNVYIRRTVLNN